MLASLMSLYVIATPIGNPDDLGGRAQKLLSAADIVIGEEAKPTRKLLKSFGIPPQKRIELLNEHSNDDQVTELVDLCGSFEVALVTDCGTPGFCDPGASLVKRCRQLGISVRSVPGPSSLMALLSVSGYRLDQFLFQGFLPANTGDRQNRLRALTNEKLPIVLMDTPYRLKKTIDDCLSYFPKRILVLGLNLSQEAETVLEGSADQILKKLDVEKAEFVLIVL
jgi:16S rRNA (cytidine1402-2'-O)-methyltransferase